MKKEIISVIIPTLNEADHIGTTLSGLKNYDGIEPIVADGGSVDGTVDLARDMQVTVIHGPLQKAGQMNAGARAAAGGIFCFLHADTQLPDRFDTHIRQTLRRPGVAAGAFALSIDAPHRGLRLVEWVANLRSRYLGVPYGDQAIFVTAEKFAAVNGYPDITILEDVEFVRRLKRTGRVVSLTAAVKTDPRRWLNLGIFRTTATNWLIMMMYYIGISPDRIATWYRREQYIDPSTAPTGKD